MNLRWLAILVRRRRYTGFGDGSIGRGCASMFASLWGPVTSVRRSLRDRPRCIKKLPGSRWVWTRGPCLPLVHQGILCRSVSLLPVLTQLLVPLDDAATVIFVGFLQERESTTTLWCVWFLEARMWEPTTWVALVWNRIKKSFWNYLCMCLMYSNYSFAVHRPWSVLHPGGICRKQMVFVTWLHVRLLA